MEITVKKEKKFFLWGAKVKREPGCLIHRLELLQTPNIGLVPIGGRSRRSESEEIMRHKLGK